MGLKIRAADWKVSTLVQVGGAAVIGGGGWWFQFQSEKADHSGLYAFFGYGLGIGGSVNGGTLPDFRSGGLRWANLECNSAFSSDDLNYSAGRLTTCGAEFAVGYGVTIITAFKLTGVFFTSQNCWWYGDRRDAWQPGTIGVGASAITTFGMWKRVGTSMMQR